jgi:ABC-2 type transport system ATP-binding protein
VSEAIVLENLEKYYPPAVSGWRAFTQPFARLTEAALLDVSFNVKAGEVMALVGANGAGKSTLLRILATLLLPTRGYARVAGFEVMRDPARVRSQLGFHMGGDGGFYPRLSASENLRFFAALNNITGDNASKRIAHVTELLGLGEVLRRQVRTLSTGTVHRLGLARAILHGPAVLLLDEPTRSLDPMAAAEFRKFLRDDLVRRQGATLLFASHTLAEVEQLASRAAVLDAGRLVACDAPAALVRSTGAATFEQALFLLTGRARQELSA